MKHTSTHHTNQISSLLGVGTQGRIAQAKNALQKLVVHQISSGQLCLQKPYRTRNFCIKCKSCPLKIFSEAAKLLHFCFFRKMFCSLCKSFHDVCKSLFCNISIFHGYIYLYHFTIIIFIISLMLMSNEASQSALICLRSHMTQEFRNYRISRDRLSQTQCKPLWTRYQIPIWYDLLLQPY